MSSKSDLASFVAAVLRDETVADLNKDIEELRQQLSNERDERLLVEVTGRGGMPVHCQASLKDGYDCIYTGKNWCVPFEQNYVVLPLADSVEELEIRLGGIVVFKINKSTVTIDEVFDDFDRGNKEEAQMGGIYFNNDRKDSGPVDSVGCTFGPVLYDDYTRLDYKNMQQLTKFANEDGRQAQGLIIGGVEFIKSKIPGIVSLLER